MPKQRFSKDQISYKKAFVGYEILFFTFVIYMVMRRKLQFFYV